MRLNVIYSTDENYSRHCATSLYSLLENNEKIDDIVIHIIENKLKEESKEKLLKISQKFQREILFYELDKICKKFKKSNTYSFSYYARLFISNLTITEGIVLYIDCDTVVNKSLEELTTINIDNYYIAAVQDTIQSYKMKFIERERDYRYINSGVLLVNLELIKRDKIEEKFLEFINKYNGDVPHHDQGILNGVCGDKILYLHPKFNVMPEYIYLNELQIKKLYKIKKFYTNTEIEEARNDMVIIHYLEKWYNRPWYKNCTHPLKNKYIEYYKKTGFTEELLNRKLKKRILFQKFLFENVSFNVFLVFQRIFDLRRFLLVKLKIRKKV